jgi:hypothetical protein
MPAGRDFRNRATAGRQRCLAAVAAAAITAAALALAAPGSAMAAAPYVMAPALSVATTSPCQDSSLTVTGTDFVPGSMVTLTLHSADASLGSVVVSAAGGFTDTVTLPEVTGTHQLVAAGAPTPRNPNTASATLHIQSCLGPVPITGYTGSSLAGGPGYAMPASIAALTGLILGGGLLAWRRRRRHAA